MTNQLATYYIYIVLTNPFLGDRFSITVETMHVDDDLGEHNNVFGLEPEVLGKRSVRYIDIGKEKLPEEHARPEYEPSLVRSTKTGRGPLTGDWQAAARPVMCCYKLVKIRMHIFAFQSRLESWILGTQANYFVKFYKKVFCLLDEWHGMAMEDIRRMEDDAQSELASKLDTFDLETNNKKGAKDKNPNEAPTQEPNISPNSTAE